MTEQTTIETIKHLEKILYSRIRTLAISYGLNQQGEESPPHYQCLIKSLEDSFNTSNFPFHKE